MFFFLLGQRKNLLFITISHSSIVLTRFNIILLTVVSVHQLLIVLFTTLFSSFLFVTRRIIRMLVDWWFYWEISRWVCIHRYRFALNYSNNLMFSANVVTKVLARTACSTQTCLVVILAWFMHIKLLFLFGADFLLRLIFSLQGKDIEIRTYINISIYIHICLDIYLYIYI